MLVQVIARENAVAVKKDQIRGAAGSCAVVATSGRAKAAVFLGHQPDRKADRAGKMLHDIRSVIRRAVVGDHDFELSVNSTLQRQR
jgi:hypothetical protein